MNCGLSLITRTDGYKPSHWLMKPPGMTYDFCYFECRGGPFSATIPIGLQYYVMEYLSQRVTAGDVESAKKDFAEYFGNSGIFNERGWRDIVDKHGGYLPLSIKFVPEGLPVPPGNVLMTVTNTDPAFPWLPSYVESLLSKVWYPTTVATLSYEIKQVIKKYLQLTGTEALLPYKLHDFGYRGVSSEESAAIGGMAHLVNFHGSDTFPAIPFARTYYDAKKMIAASIPAAEHGSILPWQREVEAFDHILSKFPSGFVAIVVDTNDTHNAVANLIGEQLREKVLSRNGVLVVRPDSGDPTTSVLSVLEMLGEKFGTFENQKGYRVLHPAISVIQGDGVDLSSIAMILDRMQRKGWSADNITFGMGGALLQKLHRDVMSCAYKCSHVGFADGTGRDVFKNPITDPGKRSKAGKLKLVLVDGAHGRHYRTVPQDTGFEKDVLVEIFRDGEIKKRYTFDEVRANTEKSIEYWNR